MVGPSGFMLFGTQNHEALLRLAGQKRIAVQYVVGNPLFGQFGNGRTIPAATMLDRKLEALVAAAME